MAMDTDVQMQALVDTLGNLSNEDVTDTAMELVPLFKPELGKQANTNFQLLVAAVSSQPAMGLFQSFPVGRRLANRLNLLIFGGRALLIFGILSLLMVALGNHGYGYAAAAQFLGWYVLGRFQTAANAKLGGVLLHARLLEIDGDTLVAHPFLLLL